MPSAYELLAELGASKDWLITANCILSVLLAAWMLRYRKLYITSREEQKNSIELIDNLSEGIYRSSPDGRQLSANKALVKLNGYDSVDEMLAGVKDIAKEWYVDPSRRDAFREILRREGKVHDFISEIYRHKTRERIWITESARLVYHPKTGKPLFYEGSVREITETVKRLQLEERFQKLTNQLPGGLFQFSRSANGVYTVPFLSQGWERLSGIDPQSEVQSPGPFVRCILDDDKPGYFESLMASERNLELWEHEFRYRTPQGVEKWLGVTAKPEAENGTITWHGYISDITAQKTREAEIEALAYFDPLTRLPNRRMLLDRMAQALSQCGKTDGHGALLFIDLDNFKSLNDTQGHDIGDTFLIQVAERLRNCIGPNDLIARIGGDEFVVIVEEAETDRASSTRRAIMTGNQVLSALREGFQLGSLHHVASASVGVVIFDGLETRPEEILKRADVAMYQAKTAGRNGLALFDPASLDRESERYRLLADLRVAFAENQLELHFQLQVDDDRYVIGAEALLRWNHPKLGMIYPDRFVPLAEQFGLNHELGSSVLKCGLETLAEWQRDAATAHLRLALNVSVQSFGSDDFVTMLKHQVREHGIDATRLTIELTEHVMAKDQARIARRMGELKEIGVRLSLDDFGTGYSSLTYLKKLPFDEVKIDGGFVADIETTESDRALVKTILAMARTLGLTAVAEHVENVRQEAFLRAFGCDYFQGYLYGKAVPAAEFMALCRASRQPKPAIQLRHQA